MATGGFSYKTKEKVVDLGPIEAIPEQEKKVALPPAPGIISFVGGIVVLVVGVRKKA